MSSLPFSPAETVTVAASTTSASGVLAYDSNQVRIYNATSAIAFVRITEAASTAVATDTPIPAGGVAIFSKSVTARHVAVILASSTGNVYFTSGEGIS